MRDDDGSVGNGEGVDDALSVDTALSPSIYAELRAVANRYFRGQPASNMLQPTALVHEAVARMLARTGGVWRDAVHFKASAAVTMRRILINHAEESRTLKRGGGWRRVSLTEAGSGSHGLDHGELLELHEALRQLAELDRRQARVVELRCFGGMTVAEIAAVTGVGASTVKEDWRKATAWLHVQLADHCE